MGRGPGWAGWGMPYGVAPHQLPTPDQELEMLKQQAQAVSRTLDELNARIHDLESKKTQSA